jgi:hypothetical protein
LDAFPNLRALYLYETKSIDIVCKNVNNQLRSLTIFDENDQLKNIVSYLNNLENLDLHIYKSPSEKLNLDQLVNLKYLYINNIKTVSISSFLIKNLKNLVNLCIESFNFEENYCFNDLSNLECLQIWESEIRMLKSPKFQFPTNLRELQLDKNKLSELNFKIEDEFLPTKLKVLRLSGNEFDVLSEGFFSSLKYLKEIDLSANRIKRLDKNVFRGLGELRKLNLSGNPLIDVEATLADLKQDNNLLKIKF